MVCHERADLLRGRRRITSLHAALRHLRHSSNRHRSKRPQLGRLDDGEEGHCSERRPAAARLRARCFPHREAHPACHRSQRTAFGADEVQRQNQAVFDMDQGHRRGGLRHLLREVQLQRNKIKIQIREVNQRQQDLLLDQERSEEEYVLQRRKFHVLHHSFDTQDTP